MRLDELTAKRTELFNSITKIHDAFKANGDKWESAAQDKEWTALNAEYDSVMSLMEKYVPINPFNIGLDDAGDGLVGTRPAPGGRRPRNAGENREYVVDANGKRQPLLRAGDSFAAVLSKESREQHKDVSLGGYVRAMAMGTRDLRERNALLESGGSTGGYTVPETLSADLIDRLRAKSRVIQAGAGTIKLDTEKMAFARLTADPTPTWAGEGVSISEVAPTFGAITFTAYTLRMLVKVSRELLEDSINLNQKLPDVFASAMASEMDRVALVGIGAGSGSGTEPIGVVNYSGINSVEMGTNGDQLDAWGKVLDCVEAIESDNAESPTVGIMHPRTKRAISAMADTTGQPLMRPEELKNMQFLPTTKMSITQTQGSANNASSIIFGGFQEMVIAMRSEIRIDLLKERYADEYMYGFLVSLRGDCGAFHEDAFCKLIGIIP